MADIEIWLRAYKYFKDSKPSLIPGMAEYIDREAVIRSEAAEIGMFAYIRRPLRSLRDHVTLPRVIRRWSERCWHGIMFIQWRLLAPLVTALYRSAVNHLSWWPLDWVGKKPIRHRDRGRCIVYYLRSFPTLSETFIQGELTALMGAGISAEVIAHCPEDEELLGQAAKSLMRHTHYLEPIRRAQLARYAWSLFWRAPFNLINAFLYILFCRYDRRKSPAFDLVVFARVVYLAGVLREKAAYHLHAPWASIDAFVAMVAARLVKIPYTVQARAYDIHQHTSAIGLGMKLANAQLVVTNSKYNESVLRSLLPPENDGKIRTIYNGIDLSQFQPPDAVRRTDRFMKILSVGDLVEPKGFEYLIRASKILRERGYTVRCEIIGGKVVTEMNYYIDLHKLRKRLALEKEVAFLGRQPFDYVVKKYEQADMFVLPAVVAKHGGRDITPNVLIEAMAMKLPVVSTTSGAIPEIVEDGVSGILVPPRDEQALVEAIIRLWTNPTLCDELGANARRKIEERFNLNKNISQFVTLFRDGT